MCTLLPLTGKRFGRKDRTVVLVDVRKCKSAPAADIFLTVYRMDDVPIPLRPAFESPFPGDEIVLKAVEKRIRELLASATSTNGHENER